MGRRVTLDEYEAGELAVEYDAAEPQEVIEWALSTFAPSRIGVCTSLQSDGVAILDMAWRVDPKVRVFMVDTGKLPPQTHELVERIQQHYGMKLEIYSPNLLTVQKMVQQHGEDLFRKSVPQRLTCCQVRKVEPLLGVLDGLDAWITGLRRDQWATRSNIRKIEIDHDHGGIAKVSPLADWTDEEVWDYIKANDVPYNSLYDHGFKSIGCAPCTRATKPGEDARAGRWWWEINAPKECGMHCAIETGGFEHEVEVLLEKAHA